MELTRQGETSPAEVLTYEGRSTCLETGKGAVRFRRANGTVLLLRDGESVEILPGVVARVKPFTRQVGFRCDPAWRAQQRKLRPPADPSPTQEETTDAR